MHACQEIQHGSIRSLPEGGTLRPCMSRTCESNTSQNEARRRRSGGGWTCPQTPAWGVGCGDLAVIGIVGVRLCAVARGEDADHAGTPRQRPAAFFTTACNVRGTLTSTSPSRGAGPPSSPRGRGGEEHAHARRLPRPILLQPAGICCKWACPQAAKMN